MGLVQNKEQLSFNFYITFFLRSVLNLSLALLLLCRSGLFIFIFFPILQSCFFLGLETQHHLSALALTHCPRPTQTPAPSAQRPAPPPLPPLSAFPFSPLCPGPRVFTAPEPSGASVFSPSYPAWQFPKACFCQQLPLVFPFTSPNNLPSNKVQSLI